MNTKQLSFSVVSILLALPLASSAQSFDSGGYFSSIAGVIGNIVQALVSILIGLLVVVFAWGIVTYIWGGADEAKIKGKKLMVWGVIGIAIVVSIWGLVSLLQGIFGVNRNANIAPLTIPGLGGSGSYPSADPGGEGSL